MKGYIIVFPFKIQNSRRRLHPYYIFSSSESGANTCWCPGTLLGCQVESKQRLKPLTFIRISNTKTYLNTKFFFLAGGDPSISVSSSIGLNLRSGSG